MRVRVRVLVGGAVVEGAAVAQRERQGGVAKKVDVTTIIHDLSFFRSEK